MNEGGQVAKRPRLGPQEHGQNSSKAPIPLPSSAVPGSATARLRATAISGLLFLPSCQHAAAEAHARHRAAWASEAGAPPVPAVLHQPVPNNFTSTQHYVSVFEPLLHEEACGALVNTYEEAYRDGRGMPVRVGAADGYWAALEEEPQHMACVRTMGLDEAFATHTFTKAVVVPSNKLWGSLIRLDSQRESMQLTSQGPLSPFVR